VERVKLKRGTSRFWALMFRMGLAKPPVPFWRVVVEARIERANKASRKFATAVTAVFVWARTIEEAEGLAALALQAEGLEAVTADAKKCRPAAAPKKEPAAVSRTELGFLPRLDAEPAQGSRRDART